MQSHSPANLLSSAQRWSEGRSYRALVDRPTIASILVIKVDHVGDFILGLDAIIKLRQAFPHARFDLACGPWNVGLARSLRIFDNIHPVAFFTSRADGEQPSFDTAMLGALAVRSYDLAVDFRIDQDTRVLMRHVASTYKAGFESDHYNHVLTLAIPHHLPVGLRDNIGLHQTLLMLRLARSVADVFGADPGLDDGLAELLRSRVAQPTEIDLSIATDKILIVCNTSSGRTVKNWPLDRFRAILRWLAVDIEAVVVLIGSKDAAEEARDIVSFCGSPNVVSAVGTTSLGQAVGLIEQASLFLGNDTGLTHIAARLHIPTVAIFSGIDPTVMWAPLGQQVTVINAPVPCSPCHILQLADCRNEHACVRNISEGAVRAAIRRHLLTARRFGQPFAGAQVTLQTRASLRYRDWAASSELQAPQRYSDNYERYRVTQPNSGFESLLHGFTARNDVNRGDLNRFYMFMLIFDQIIKEGLVGDVAELGVYKGNTAVMLADLARRIGSTAYLLDTYTGFAKADMAGVDADKRPEFSDTSLDQVRALVGTTSVQYVEGFFPQTAEQIPPEADFVLVHIDCDLYAPFNAALEFFYDRLVPGGYLIMHDYASLHWQGAELAVDRFFASRSECVLPVPDGAGTVVMRKSKRANDARNWFTSRKVTGFAQAWVLASTMSSEDFLQRGWHRPEEWGVWGLGESHILYVEFSVMPVGDVDIEVESRAVLQPARDRQTISVIIDDVEQAQWEYDVSCNQAVRRVLAPAAAIRSDRSSPYLNIEFRPQDVRSPNAADSLNPDGRPLGMGLVRLRQRYN